MSAKKVKVLSTLFEILLMVIAVACWAVVTYSTRG